MYSEINLDLQSFAKRVYDSILYQSTFYKFLNTAYIGELRQTGAPVIEIAKTTPVSVNVRQTKEIQTGLTPALTTYTHTMVDLTELNMDYSIRVPLMVTGSDITNAIQDAADLEDSAIARQIDTYGYGKLAAASMDEFEWDPTTQADYIELLTTLKATLFNKDIYSDYRLGLGAVEYAKLVAALTSVLKFETLAGREGVDMGEVGRAYGVDAIFPINDAMLNDIKGYFFNPIAVVGDTFFSAFVQHNSPQGYPGYYVLEGTQSFGAAVVRPEAIIRLVEEVSA
ncbi:MAG: hypothetical protein GX038_02255 [Erysipelothrix sp.]|nr:hypothetical protein [Erysipelothrix sp.]